MVNAENSDSASSNVDEQKIARLPCGCIYKDTGWMLMRINECGYHHRRRTTKRPYRPKAECVRP
ncbi:MAG: hypothetical protein FWF62_01980 [Candidatus Bathyarchaeota archaeon]|nr:hypothetical protein [Candidatus Termiticorpusculum sp.]